MQYATATCDYLRGLGIERIPPIRLGAAGLEPVASDGAGFRALDGLMHQALCHGKRVVEGAPPTAVDAVRQID
jgi:hypothetical protein